MAASENYNDLKNTILCDFTYLDELSDDDNEFKATMISYFIDNAPITIGEMKTHHNNKNWKELREITHKFKPQIGFMGINIIAGDVEAIEQSAANKTNLEKIGHLMEKVEKICGIAIEQLKQELQKIQPE
jgi:hypothetical protein